MKKELSARVKVEGSRNADNTPSAPLAQNRLLAAVFRPLNYMPCIKIGNIAISGRANLNKKLWNNGAVVHVWKKYFIVYELRPHSR